MSQSFRTDFNPPSIVTKLGVTDHIFCIGSCFATSMAEKLTDLRFNSHLNPFGVLYNIESMTRLVRRISMSQLFTEEDFERHGDRFNSFELHGQMSGPDLNACLKMVNDHIYDCRSRLARTQWMIVTLGTSIVYLRDKEIVANCHKQPQAGFNKAMMSVDDIEKSLGHLINHARQLNPNMEFLLTVSPIRHLRDGAVDNNRSKARLILAVERILERVHGVHYFPSYEILMDDLRDYRFYANDMIHPNEMAIAYIWEKLSSAWMSENAKEYASRSKALLKLLSHRPLHPGTSTHADFLFQTLKKIENHQLSYPQNDWQGAINEVRLQMNDS